jgi:hypothetical protein
MQGRENKKHMLKNKWRKRILTLASMAKTVYNCICNI